MNHKRERYVNLAPWSVDLEKTIALLAVRFFSPSNFSDICKVIGKTSQASSICPMSSHEFLQFLDKMGCLTDAADKHVYQIRHLLSKLALDNILVEVGSSRRHLLIPKSYYSFHEVSIDRSKGSLWLAKALGGRFVHSEVSPAIVQIVGEDELGNTRSGSGIVFHPHHILTSSHVVSGMKVSETQIFQGKEFNINKYSIFAHGNDDVAVIRVDKPLNTTPGLVFLAPTIAQTVYTFGYPKVPNVRPKMSASDEAYLIMQSGEVTNESIIATDKAELFLYSAISRPGDSGGAIVSDDGYVVGMTTNLAEGKYENETAFSPHYAGISSHVIAKAVKNMSLDIEIPYETFE